jgi:hypothetical protein
VPGKRRITANCAAASQKAGIAKQSGTGYTYRDPSGKVSFSMRDRQPKNLVSGCLRVAAFQPGG